MAADANTSKRRWYTWIWEEVLVSLVTAAGLEVAIKSLGPKVFEILSNMLGEHLKGKILNDKRAELLEDFRNMEAAGVNIDNLIRRHKKSMTDHSEHRFVDLLCKTIADPNDPTKGRQATLKWLNDMSNAKFDQMLYLLDHDVVIQWFQKGRQRAGKIIKQISDGLKAKWQNLAQWLRSHLGGFGNWIVVTAEAAWDLFVRFCRWVNSSKLRIVAVAVILLPVAIFVALIVGPIRRRAFPWLGAAIGVLLIIIAYLRLVPTSLDRSLWFTELILLAAVFFLWKFALVRNPIFILLAAFTLIFFFGGRTTSLAKMQSVWASAQGNHAREQEVGGLQAQISAQDKELAILRNKKESEAHVQNVEQPLASARPEPASSAQEEATESALTTIPPGHCGTSDSADSPTFQYGDLIVIVERCAIVGTQLRFSGMIQYDGTEKHLLAFHQFRISDNAGRVYSVQSGRFGGSDGFGTGYSSQLLMPHAPIAFAFVAGTVDTRSPPVTINLTLPNTQSENGDVTFTRLMERR